MSKETVQEKYASIVPMLRRNPYRGIRAELAKEMGVHWMTLYRAVMRGDLRILAAIADKMEQRDREIERVREGVFGRIDARISKAG